MEYLSLDEAAQALDVTRRRAQALVEKGQLRAQRVGGRWLVESADAYQRRRMVAQRGRPLKASTAWNAPPSPQMTAIKTPSADASSHAPITATRTSTHR